MPNVLALKICDPHELKSIIENYRILYSKYFKLWENKEGILKGYNPIILSLTLSNIKYPFVEAWRYLNRPKNQPINLFWVRHFEFPISFLTYDSLSNLDFTEKKMSSFLHNLAEIEKSSNLTSLVEMEIWNNRKTYPEIYENMKPRNKRFNAQELLNWYKILRTEKKAED